MATDDYPSTTEDDELVAELVSDYVARVRAGEGLERSAFLAEHPELAFKLAKSLEAVRDLDDRPAQAASLTGTAATEVRDRADFGIAAPKPLPNIIGAYEVREELGRGAMGRVFLAEETGSGRLLALKTLHPGMDMSANQVRRLRREALAAQKLQHPNIVRTYDAGDYDGTPYLVMQLIEGGKSLKDLCLPGDPLPVSRALDLVRQVALGLDYAHREGVVHRDIKPSNILMLGDKPMITDFGLAHVTDQELSRVTRSGEMLGTLCYMPPEQATGERDPNARWDIYALGASLYECLTCRPPFLGDSPGATFKMITQDDPPPPSSYGADVDSRAVAICIKCLEKDPAARYQSGSELADDIERYLGGKSVRAPHVNWALRRVRRFLDRHRRAIALGLAATAFFAVALWQLDRWVYSQDVVELRGSEGGKPTGSEDFHLRFLLRATRDKDEETRYLANTALVRAGASERASAALLAAARDPSEKVRFRLGESLLRKPHPEAANICRILLGEESGSVASIAVRLAIKLGDPEFTPRIEKLAQSEDKILRQFVLSNLVSLLGSDFPRFAADYLHHGPPKGQMELMHRFTRGQAPPPIAALVAVLDSPNHSSEAKAAARASLDFCLAVEGERYKQWWDENAANLEIQRCVVLYALKRGSGYLPGDLVWTVDNQPVGYDRHWPPGDVAAYGILRQAQLIQVNEPLGKHRWNDLYIGLLKGVPIGRHAVVKNLKAALHGPQPGTRHIP